MAVSGRFEFHTAAACKRLQGSQSRARSIGLGACTPLPSVFLAWLVADWQSAQTATKCGFSCCCCSSLGMYMYNMYSVRVLRTSTP